MEPAPRHIMSNLALVVFRDGNYVGTYDNTNDDEPEAGNPFILKNLDAGHTYQIAIEVKSGPPPSLIKDEIFNDGDPSTVIMNGANAGTVYGHHMPPYAITVGAVDSANTPGNGGSLASESFSSSGAGTSSGSTMTAARCPTRRSFSARLPSPASTTSTRRCFSLSSALRRRRPAWQPSSPTCFKSIPR
jgi:hypothetical protein